MDEMSNEQNCIGKHCHKRGVPAEGYDFFVCERCLEVLDVMIIGFAIVKSYEAKRGLQAVQ